MKKGDWGIEAEYNGIVLLAKGYTGKPLIYSAENKYFLGPIFLFCQRIHSVKAK